MNDVNNVSPANHKSAWRTHLLFISVVTAISMIANRLFNLVADQDFMLPEVYFYQNFEFGLIAAFTALIMVGLVERWPRYFKPTNPRLIYTWLIFIVLTTGCLVYQAKGLSDPQDSLLSKIEGLVAVIFIVIIISTVGFLLVQAIYTPVAKKLELYIPEDMALPIKKSLLAPANLWFELFMAGGIFFSCPLFSWLAYQARSTGNVIGTDDIILAVVVWPITLATIYLWPFMPTLKGGIERCARAGIMLSIVFLAVYPFFISFDAVSNSVDEPLLSTLASIIVTLLTPVTCIIFTTWCMGVLYGSLFHFGLIKVSERTAASV